MTTFNGKVPQMAHELDVNLATGRLASFAVGETPWHKEGFTLDAPPSFSEALRLAGSDYDVALEPLHVELNGMMLKSPTGKACVRTDRNEILGVVGDDYRPIQNRDAFRVLEPLIDQGLAMIETGGTLRHGADAWFLVRFNLDDSEVRASFGSEVQPYACIATNHTGRRKVVCMETPIRVVCANTLSAAFGNHGNAVAVSHRGENGTARMIEAAESLFSGLVMRYRGIAERFQVMREATLTVEAFTRSVLDTAAPIPTDEKSPRYKSMVDRALDRRNALTASWERGIGHSGNHSAWEAFNGAVELFDHGDLWKVRGSKVASLMDGSLASLKSDVLTAILAEVR